jgi:hypothetical protein
MEFVAVHQTFDRENIDAVLSDRESEAGVDPSSVDQDRARPALTTVAPFFGSG